MLEGMEARHVGHGVSEFQRLSVVQKRVEKGPENGPHRAPDDPLAAFGNECIDDVAGLPLRDQGDHFSKLRESVHGVPSRHGLTRFFPAEHRNSI
ncbi:hypothetical protein D3C86_1965240 [compost metagenome]